MIMLASVRAQWRPYVSRFQTLTKFSWSISVGCLFHTERCHQREGLSQGSASLGGVAQRPETLSVFSVLLHAGVTMRKTSRRLIYISMLEVRGSVGPEACCRPRGIPSGRLSSWMHVVPKDASCGRGAPHFFSEVPRLSSTPNPSKMILAENECATRKTIPSLMV